MFIVEKENNKMIMDKTEIEKYLNRLPEKHLIKFAVEAERREIENAAYQKVLKMQQYMNIKVNDGE